MKLATFNINNVNKRLPHLLQWEPARHKVIASPGSKPSRSARAPGKEAG